MSTTIRKKLKMRIILRNIFTVFILLGAASNVSATLITLIIDDGQLHRATNIDVNGKLYDVEFIDGSCLSLFGGCNEPSDFQFTTEALVHDASEALLDQVFTSPEFVFSKLRIRGCEAGACFVNIAFDGDGDTFTSRSLSFIGVYPVGAGTLRRSADYNSIILSSVTYARWTVSAPSTLIIWGLGLIALASRRFKK